VASRSAKRPRQRKQSPISANLDEQVAQLKALTLRTGTLHELQIQQLKIWPRVALPHTTSSEARVDTTKHVVEFRVEVSGRAPSQLTDRLKGLDQSVKDLLGTWWRVKVVQCLSDGTMKALYNGAPSEVLEQQSYAGTDFEAGKIVPEKPWQFR
jgi:hypothetical protein